MDIAAPRLFRCPPRIQWDSDDQLSSSEQQLRYTFVQQAINAARLATVVDPMNPLSWENLSSVYAAFIGWARNSEDFAILAARQAVLLSPGRPESHQFLAEIYARAGRTDEAEEELKKALNLARE